MPKITMAALPAFALFATLTTTACATATPVWYRRTPVASDVITSAEIGRVSPQNAYAALEQLRPFFLRARPSAVDVRGERPQLNVFIDGYFAGDLDVLKTIPVSDIESITRVQPAMAFALLGSERAGDGVLMVRLRGRGVC